MLLAAMADVKALEYSTMKVDAKRNFIKFVYIFYLRWYECWKLMLADSLHIKHERNNINILDGKALEVLLFDILLRIHLTSTTYRILLE